MAEGTRLKDLNEHIHHLDERLRQLTSECDNRMEERLHLFSEECNKQIGDLARQIEEIQYEGQHRYESLQSEATRRHENIQQEGAKRHQQLLELLMAGTNQAKGVGGPATGTREGQLPIYPKASSSMVRKSEEEKGKGILPTPYRANDTHESSPKHTSPRTPYHIPFPKLKFPTFEGTEPREWADRCEQYFNLHQIPEQQWVEVATMHFTGRAHKWMAHPMRGYYNP